MIRGQALRLGFEQKPVSTLPDHALGSFRAPQVQKRLKKSP
jgi:hypothetical protein